MTRREFLNRLPLPAALSAFLGFPASSRAAAGNPYYNGPPSDHFDGTRFFVPGHEMTNGFSEFLRWRFNGQRAEWPASAPGLPAPELPQRVGPQEMRITLIGHATVLIQIAGLNILTDPVFSDRASPVGFAGPARVNPPAITPDRLPPIDVVLLTHNHYDHCDAASIERLVALHDPRFVTPLGNDTIIRKAAPNARTEAGDWGDTVELAPGIAATFHPWYHWSARGIRDRRMALWAAFALQTPAGRVFHVGDTGFGDGEYFRKARQRHGDFDLAILPIGAYEPRWFMSGQHVNPAESVQTARLLGARRALGHHWGTFQLTDEAIDAPPAALAEALAGTGIDFRPLRPGESVLV